MTTTSVKGMSNVMNAVTAANVTGTTGNASDVSFQSFWNQQTSKNPSSQDNKVSVSDTQKANPQDEVLKAKETVRKPVKENKEVKTKQEGVTEEQTKEAMEVLGTTAREMMQKVADTFGISVEELQQMMDELGMSALDILNTEMLSALLLKAADVQDTMALLTNEGLYADYVNLMNVQQQMLAEAREKLQLAEEQLKQLIAQLDNQNVRFDMQMALQGAFADEAENGLVEITDMNDSAEQNAQTKDMSVIFNEENGLLTEENKLLTTQTTAGKEQAAGKENQNSSNEQSGNLLLQNLKADGFMQNVNATQTSSVWGADTQEIMKQIMDYMKIQVKPEVSDIEMQLHPESLGTLHIHVSSKGGNVTANFVTQNEAVRAALEGQMVQLKESFAEQGVKVDAIEVTVQTHQFERNLDQGRGSNQSEPEKKNRTRRINLNVGNGLEETEEIAQEDMLVAEMMTANGNTVDYTA